MTTEYTKLEKTLAWCVHIFTATGMIVGFKALIAAASGDIYQSVCWLLVSVMIDSIDGTFARRFKVKEVLPRMDGKMIDAVIDFVNFIITPVIIFFRLKMVPEVVVFPCIIGIIFSSLYHIGNTDQLTEDNRIKGFPAWWNLVIYYLWILELNGWLNFCIIMLFIILHFLPVTFIYLSRLKQNVLPAVLALILLVIANIFILFQYPHSGNLLKVIAVVPLAFLLVLGSFKRNLIRLPVRFKNKKPPENYPA